MAEEGIKNFIICTKESSIDITKRKNTVHVESPRLLYMVKTEILQGARRIAECTYNIKIVNYVATSRSA